MVLAQKNKKIANSSLHKKRYSQHRKHTKPYLRTYWPYLPILMVLGIGLVINNFFNTQSKHQNLNDAKISTVSLLNATNLRRSALDINKLELNNQLNATAQNSADSMVSNNYWAYEANEENFNELSQNTEYDHQTVTENLAYGFNNSSDVVSGWMSSPVTRSNILNDSYQDMGIGISKAANYLGRGPEIVIVTVYGETNTQTGGSINPLPNQPLNTIVGTTENSNISKKLSLNVSRIQLLTRGNAPWALSLVILLCVFGVFFLVIRHSILWHKAIVRGEAFVIQHVWIDLILIGIVMITYVLSRSAGITI